jgi:hypothetical protein
VAEYWDRFIEMSRYTQEEVADDPKKHERFLEGLAGPLRYQLTSHTFPSFQQLLDSYCLGVHAQRAGGAEEEGRHSGTVREPHSPPLYLTVGSPVPSKRPDRSLWPAAAVSVPATVVPAVSALSSAASASRAADSMPCVPAALSDESSWYAREARCTSHPRGQHLL